jgi:hypothetical protein
MQPNSNSTVALSPADKERQKTAAKFMLFGMGLSQKQTAYALGINKDTLCRWVKEYGWRGKLRQKQAKSRKYGKEYTDSLTAFVAYIRIHNQPLYQLLEPHYTNFLHNI